MSRIAAIVPAAGLGTRMGAETPKQFLELDGVPLVIFTLRRLAACAAITDFIIATRAEDIAALEKRIAEERLGRPVRVDDEVDRKSTRLNSSHANISYAVFC